jgi:hypothetical protein
MSTLFKKLQYKEHPDLLLLNAPESFRTHLTELNTDTKLAESLEDGSSFSFILAFVQYQEEINHLTPLFNVILPGDGLLWFAYPKGSSKKYTCNFNRDAGWEILGQFGFEAVRQVSIDEDWTALRFRRVAYIKKMHRRKSFALSEKGKKKTKGK